MSENWLRVAEMLGYPGEKEMFLDLYINQHKGIHDLQKIFSCSQARIHGKLKQHNIPRRPRGGAHNFSTYGKRLFLADQRYIFLAEVEDICKTLNVSSSLVYRYRDFVRATPGPEVRAQMYNEERDLEL